MAMSPSSRVILLPISKEVAISGFKIFGATPGLALISTSEPLKPRETEE